jgi:hypothetical protein
MKKNFLVIASILLAVAVVIIYYRKVGKYCPNTVFFEPSGFIQIEDAMEGNENLIRFEFFETGVFFLDKNNNGLGTWDIRDSSFIVKCLGKLYINKDLFDEMVEIAKNNGG